MARPILPGAAAGWIGLYLLAYVWVVASQDGAVARWYVAILVLGLLACVAAALNAAPTATITAALVLTAAAALAGMLTIGVLLVPAVAALAIALARRPRTALP